MVSQRRYPDAEPCFRREPTPPGSDTLCARSVFILLQVEQHLTEPFLAAIGPTALGALAGEIDEFRDAVPTRAARSGISLERIVVCLVSAEVVNGLVLVLVVLFVEIV